MEVGSAVAASIAVSGFRPKTDVVLAENRCGFGRKQMWRRPKPLDGMPSANNKALSAIAAKVWIFAFKQDKFGQMLGLSTPKP